MNDYNGIVIQRDSYGHYNVFIRFSATGLKFLYTSPDIKHTIIIMCSNHKLTHSGIIDLYPAYRDDVYIEKHKR